MLYFYTAALTLCVTLLFGTNLALAAAHRRAEKQVSYVLHLLRLGLILSCCSYALCILTPHKGQFSFFSLLFCRCGTVVIGLALWEHRKLQRERLLPASARCEEEETDLGASLLQELPPGLPRMTFRAAQVLHCAQDEARRCRRSCVDTEHLLLGLLQTPQSEGVCILDRLGVGQERVHREMMEYAADSRRDIGDSSVLPAPPIRLTERAQEVMVLAGHEVHRFEKSAIGTEHLLLGLVLKGTGSAASALFAEGVTVERVRDEIIRVKNNQYDC